MDNNDKRECAKMSICDNPRSVFLKLCAPFQGCFIMRSYDIIMNFLLIITLFTVVTHDNKNFEDFSSFY